MPRSSRASLAFLTVLTILFTTALALPGHAASWVKNLKPAGYGTGVAVVPHGSDVVVLWSDGRERSLRFVELDRSGNVKAARSYPRAWAQIQTANQTPDGGIALGLAKPITLHRGSLPPVMQLNGGMVKLSPELDRAGERFLAPAPSVSEEDRLAGTRVHASTFAPDGDLFLVADLGTDKSMLLHLDPKIDTPWMKVLDWAGLQEMHAVAPSGDGVVIAGTAGGQAIVARFDESGSSSWQRLLGPGVVRALNVERDGSIIVTGTNFGSGLDILVARLSADGSPRWVNTYGSSADEGGMSIHNSKRGTILVGAAQKSREGQTVLALELDSGGAILSDILMPVQTRGEVNFASGSDGAGELVFAIHSEAGLTVARYDGGAPPTDCVRAAQLTANHAQPGGSELPLQSDDILFYPSPPTPDTTQLVEVASTPIACDAAPADIDDASDESEAGKQWAELVAYKESLRTKLKARNFDELESIAAELRDSLETVSTGDFRIREFYLAFAPYCDDDCWGVNALLDEWKRAKADSPTPRIAIALACNNAIIAKSKTPGLWARANEEIDSVPRDFNDPELWRLRISTAESDDEGWEAFEKGTNVYPDFYNLYTGVVLRIDNSEEAREKVTRRARSLTKARLGDSIYARIASAKMADGQYIGWVSRDWQGVQAGYRDLFKLHPASYKNMVRYALLACTVRDTRLAAGIVAHLGRNWRVALKGGEFGLPTWNPCHRLATSPRFEPWVEGPPVAFGEISEAKPRAVPVPAGADEPTVQLLHALGFWVDYDRSNWPRVVFDGREAERAGLRNAATGFFVQASDSRPRYVTASAAGAGAIGPVTVRSADGTERTVHPEPSEHEALSRSVRFDVDLPGVKILRTTPYSPEQWDRVLVPTPGARGQTVVVGIVRDVVVESGRERRTESFKLVVSPGAELPASGSPVLDERGWVIGVVARTSTVNGVPDVECEGIHLILRKTPPTLPDSMRK